MMKCRSRSFVFSFAVAVATAFTLAPASAGADELSRPDPVPITNPAELEESGYEADTPGVYRDEGGRYFRLLTAADIAATPGGIDELLGVPCTSCAWVGPSDFQPQTEGQDFIRVDGVLFCDAPEATEEFFAPLHLPNGAQITNLYYYGRDGLSGASDVNNAVLKRVCQFDSMNDPVTTEISARIGTTGPEAPGNFVAVDFIGSLLVDNQNCHYLIEVNLGDESCKGSSIAAFKATVRWQNVWFD